MTTLDRLLANSRAGRNALIHQELITHVTERIWEEMEKQNITSAHLAKKLNVSRSAVSQMLAGSNNFTLAKLSEIAEALSLKAALNLIPKVERLRNVRNCEKTFRWENRLPIGGNVFLPTLKGAHEGYLIYPVANEAGNEDYHDAIESIAA